MRNACVGACASVSVRMCARFCAGVCACVRTREVVPSCVCVCVNVRNVLVCVRSAHLSGPESPFSHACALASEAQTVVLPGVCVCVCGFVWAVRVCVVLHVVWVRGSRLAMCGHVIDQSVALYGRQREFLCVCACVCCAVLF